MSNADKIVDELNSIEKARKEAESFIGRYKATIDANVERARLRVRSIEGRLQAMKRGYELQRDEANDELSQAKLVLSSLEAALGVVAVPKPYEELADALKNNAANRRKTTRTRRK